VDIKCGEVECRGVGQKEEMGEVDDAACKDSREER
jgi:hypothetical protein